MRPSITSAVHVASLKPRTVSERDTLEGEELSP